MCGGAHVPRHACWGQRSTFRSWFSPVSMWIMEMGLKSAGLGGHFDPLTQRTVWRCVFELAASLSDETKSPTNAIYGGQGFF